MCFRTFVNMDIPNTFIVVTASKYCPIKTTLIISSSGHSVKFGQCVTQSFIFPFLLQNIPRLLDTTCIVSIQCILDNSAVAILLFEEDPSMVLYSLTIQIYVYRILNILRQKHMLGASSLFFLHNESVRY